MKKILLTILAMLGIASSGWAATREVVVKDSDTSIKIITTTDPVVSTRTLAYSDLLVQIQRATSDALKAIKVVNDLKARKQQADDLGVVPSVPPVPIDPIGVTP